MSLRHLFPVVELPDLRKDVEPAVAPPVMRRPHEVSFRPTTDLSTVVPDMIGYAHVRLQAAVGAGKSSRVPLALSATAKVPVVHALPSRHMAKQLHMYLSSGDNADKYRLALQGDDVLGEHVTITTYPWIVSRLLLAAVGKIPPLGKVILYADEVHESDCYSYVVRTLGSSILGLVSFVEASATFEAERMPMREAEGKMESRLYEMVNPNSWEPSDLGQPWSVSELHGNVLVFLDDDVAAKNLTAKYAAAGVVAYRLHSRMSLSTFEDAMIAMSNPRVGIVALIADYSFRNGFTFDVSRIIDTGVVSYKYVKDGARHTGYRTVFELEKYQALGRGGRTKGSECQYFFPSGMEVKSAICSLEGVEIEAAALLLRFLGYAPPKPLKALALMSSGNVPKALTTALNGFVPLPLLAEADMHPLVLPEMTGEIEPEVVDVLKSYVESPTTTEIPDLFADFKVPKGLKVPVVGAIDVLEQLQSVSAAATVLEYGHYYYCTGVEIGSAIPGGTSWEDMLATVHAKPLVVTGFSRDKKAAILGKFLLEYNSMMLHGAALARVLAHKDSLSKLSSMYPDVVKRWSSWLTQEAREKEGLACSLLKAMESLREEGLNFVAVDGDEKLEQSMAEQLVGVLRNAVDAVNPVVDTAGFFDTVRKNAGTLEAPDFPRLEAPGGSIGCQMALAPVRVAGKQKHNAVLQVDNPLGWTEEAYASAISRTLEFKGMSVNSINKLKLLGSSVDPGRVMQRVRDLGPKHRGKLSFSIVRKGG